MYNCKHFFITPIILIPLALFVFGIYCLFNIKNPFVTSVKRIFIFGVVCALMSLIVFSVILFNYIKEYKNVFLEYKNGNYEEIEGYVSELEVAPFLGSGTDSFVINDKKFDSGIDFGAGYKRGAAYGGIINKNGLHVKIKYISYKNTLHIMYIDIIDE